MKSPWFWMTYSASCIEFRKLEFRGSTRSEAFNLALLRILQFRN
jgi:hypothetical protein